MATSPSSPDTPVYDVEREYVKRWRVEQEDWTLLSIEVEMGGMVTERWLKHPRHTKNNDKGDKGDHTCPPPAGGVRKPKPGQRDTRKASGTRHVCCYTKGKPQDRTQIKP